MKRRNFRKAKAVVMVKRASYQRLPTACDVGVVSIQEALMRMHPPIAGKTWMVPAELTLHVSLAMYLCARQIVHDMSGKLPPHINVIRDAECDRDEWFLEDGNGAAVGSAGIPF